MSKKAKLNYYVAALLFLIGCVASRASIVNAASPYGNHDAMGVLRSILVILLTIGVGLYSYFGLIKKTSPHKLPKSILGLGIFSIIVSSAILLLTIILFIWWIISPPNLF